MPTIIIQFSSSHPGSHTSNAHNNYSIFITPFPTLPCLAIFIHLIEQIQFLHSTHDVVASIDEHNFAGDGSCARTGEEEGYITNLALLDIAP